MCGIVGFSEPVGEPGQSRRTAELMLAQLRHRGPEAAVVARVGSANLGACALTFTAPGSFDQPYLSARGDLGLVFNGEIYNCDQLRQALGPAAQGLHESSEAALILAAYCVFGLDFVDHLQGMFAIAIHDAKQRRTVLVRDRLGQKPLYWCTNGAGIIFGSELKAVLAHPQCRREPDHKAWLAYLIFNAVPSPQTPFRSVRKLAPASMVVYQDGRTSQRQYWQLPIRPRTMNAAGAEEVLATAIQSAVRRRIVSTPLPLGVLTSGGVDSSLVAAYALDSTTSPLKTFCAEFDQPSFNEGPFAAQLARTLGSEHHPVHVSGEALARVVTDDLPRIDEPLADPSLLPTILVCRRAREQVKGVLSGDGADELLLGYPFFHAARLLQRLDPWLSGSAIRLLQRAAARLPGAHTNLHPAYILGLLSRGLGARPERRFYTATCAFPTSDWQRIVRPEVLQSAADAEPFAELDQLLTRHPEPAPMTCCQLGMIRHFLQDVILTKVDRASMLSSLEVRSPYLDTEVVAAAAAIPQALKLARTSSKVVLRRIAARVLPEQLAMRRKQGFRPPIAALICSELRDLTSELLSPAALRGSGFFQPDAAHTLLQEHWRGDRDHQKPLWSMLCFQIWHQSWVEASPACSSDAGSVLPENARVRV